MSVQFAIRSYRRAETLASKTLPLLERLGVPLADVIVFLSDPDEGNAYRAATSDRVRLVAGRPGCGPNGNAIQHFYPEGTRVISIDDDLRDLLVKRNDKLIEPIDPWEFDEVVRDGFAASGGGLWGIHPVPNPYFQRFKISRDLRYICGGFFGTTTSRDPALDVRLEDKEDFERSLLFYLRDGFVTRLNWVSMRTVGYSGKGGMQEARTAERVDASARELAARYPMLCSLNETKKSKWAEVRLRDRRPQPEALA